MKSSMHGDQRLSRALAALAAAGLFFSSIAAFGYSPSDAKVRAMVAKARQYLASQKGSEMGEAALIGMAMYKSGSDESDPKIQEAVALIRARLQDGKKTSHPLNYNVAVSLIFLCEVNPNQYRPEIQGLLDILLQRQEPHGGWSYWPGESGSHNQSTGDSSQSQYGTLALWEARRKGFNVPQEAAQRVANFWMSTQSIEGAWGYQGHPAPLGQRQQQQYVRPSIGIAGLSSCYVIGDLFGLSQQRTSAPKSNQPAALQKVQEKTNATGNYPSAAINGDLMRQTMQLGGAYIDKVHKYENDTWIIYYMYATERYRSFQEFYTGKVETKWYDDGVEFLEKSQADAGNWHYHLLDTVDTSFAVLFLNRSTKATIDKEYGLGLVRGGRGLPADIGKVTVDEKTGDVINPEIAGTVEQLMAILQDPNNKNFDSVASNPEKVIEALVRPQEDEDQVAREQRIARLKEMVSKGDYQQRLIAVKALARTGELDKAPLLLYALSDGDPRVRRAADEGLRFLSRKLNGFGAWDDSKPETLEKVRLQWKEWLLSIRPTAELLD